MPLLIPPTSPVPIDPRDIVRRKLGVRVKSSQLTGKDAFCSTHVVTLEDGRAVLFRLSNSASLAHVVDAEAFTLSYIADRTTIPVPKVLSHGPVFEEKESSITYLILEVSGGVPADTVFETMASHEHNVFIAQLAGWMLELFAHRFSDIGNLKAGDGGGFVVGPIVRRPFYVDGRAQFSLDRGPFKTARAYYLACAQREIECARQLFVQNASPSYQRDLEETRFQVERCVGLLTDLIKRCDGLDDDELAPFSLDIHDIGLKNILVSPDDHAKIVAIVDWQFVNTRPLWCCARMPTWLRPSLTDGPSEIGKARLSTIFRAEIARVEGIDSTFLHALDADDSPRCMLDEFADYDAFKDAFLLLPALENILATLPGQEDVAGLTALLDPSTLVGRVARITLLTRGSNAMFLAMTPPKSPESSPSALATVGETKEVTSPGTSLQGGVPVHTAG